MSNRRQGFTIIELIVTISMVVIVSAGLLISYPEFRQRLSIKRTAQEIVLAIRQAQVYSMGVKGTPAGASMIFPGYGIHFDKTSPKSFLLFSDNPPGNNTYGPEDTNVETFQIQTSEQIYDLCGNEKTGPATCGLTALDIVYWRPYPLVYLSSGGFYFSDAEIKIQSANGQKKKIVIWSGGYIGIEDQL